MLASDGQDLAGYAVAGSPTFATGLLYGLMETHGLNIGIQKPGGASADVVTDGGSAG